MDRIEVVVNPTLAVTPDALAKDWNADAASRALAAATTERAGRSFFDPTAGQLALMFLTAVSAGLTVQGVVKLLEAQLKKNTKNEDLVIEEIEARGGKVPRVIIRRRPR